jgi:transglutaminase-like putative cysteine protease
MNGPRVARRRGRVIMAAAILAAWLGGLGTLVFREYLDSSRDRLADAGSRVEPGSLFFSVLQGGRQIGYASSSVDTTPIDVKVAEVFRVELPVGGREQAAEVRGTAALSRRLALLNFTFMMTAESGVIRTVGEWETDSIFRFVVRSGGPRQRPDTHRVTTAHPIYHPSAAPMAFMLTAPPAVGRDLTLRVVDPVGLAVRETRLRLTAETLFVVNDSAVMDTVAKRWAEARPDTVRAWKLDAGGEPTIVSGWIDRQGRVIDVTQLGTLHVLRRPYEVAVENWRQRLASDSTVTADRDILETTAISANRRVARAVNRLSYRLGGAPLDEFELDGLRQRFSGDTLFVQREAPELLRADFVLPDGARDRFREETSAQPLIESGDSRVIRAARRIVAGEKDPERAARRLNAWVHDSLRKRVTFGIPSARQVLATRSGDCNEHTQLFVALARASGIPARVVVGLVYIDGKFYYHAWPEIRLRDWVAVDPTLGQFPADAGHLRFVSGGLDRQADLLRLIGKLTIDVLN